MHGATVKIVNNSLTSHKFSHVAHQPFPCNRSKYTFLKLEISFYYCTLRYITLQTYMHVVRQLFFLFVNRTISTLNGKIFIWLRISRERPDNTWCSHHYKTINLPADQYRLHVLSHHQVNTVFTTAQECSALSVTSILFTTSYPSSSRYILLLSSRRPKLSRSSFLSDFPTNIFYAFPLSPMYPGRFNIHYLITLTIFGEIYNLLSLRRFFSQNFASVSSEFPNVLVNTSACFSVLV